MAPTLLFHHNNTITAIHLTYSSNQAISIGTLFYLQSYNHLHLTNLYSNNDYGI